MDSNEFYKEGVQTTDPELAVKYSLKKEPNQMTEPNQPVQPQSFPPPPQPPSPPSMPSASRPAKKSGLTTTAKILILIVVLILIGAGLALVTKVWDPVWNPFRKF